MNLKRLLVISVWVLSLCIGASAWCQQVVKISQPAWVALTPVERESIQKKHIVSLIEQETFGMVIDAQGVNESTSGTSGGAALGGAFANAAYVDTAIRGGDYSAKTQLAAGILGAILGSTLDKKPNAQFHYRYAVKLGSGNIQYFDQTNGDPFRHPAGVCVSVPNIVLIDQQLCAQNAASLRVAYLEAPIPQPAALPVTPPSVIQKETSVPASPIVADTTKVNCKLGTLAPVRTSAEKCQLINGSQVE